MKLLLTSVAKNIVSKALPLLPKTPEECKIVCIPTAANVYDDPKDWFYSELGEFRRLGYNLIMLDLENACEADVAAQLQDADIVYVSGGNTFFLLEKMKACHFEKHIREALVRGAVYIGSSAGTVVCCPDIDYVSTMDDPSVATLEDTKGLNLIDFFVMVHMDHASFSQKANDRLLEMGRGSIPVVCLKDDQAVFVDGLSITLV